MLYILIFIFGYITCKTFYFYKSARLSLTMIRASHIIYLSSIVKALEYLSHSREMMREHLLKTEKTAPTISSFEFIYEKEVQTLKNNSLHAIVALHPEFFQSVIDFEDWDSAMEFLLNNKEAALSFWDRSHD